MTAATVLSDPASIDGSGPGGIADGITLTLDELDRELAEAARAGGCHRPVLLAGHVLAVDRATGEARPLYDTATEPGGVLAVPCGNRREHECPPCSRVYKRDARQLVRAGLTGGKGLPDTIAAHPCVFATFTAPGYGPVHARRKRGSTVLPCRPRRDHHERRCPHGRDISCPVRHRDDDPRLGRALCADCYDYRSAATFNRHCPDLWRRFTTYLPRHLARLAGTTQRELRSQVAIRYVKVAEYQARGVIHFHAVIRLDAPGDDYQPPPARWTTTQLCDAIRAAAASVTVTSGQTLIRFGNQVDLRSVGAGTGRALSAAAVGNYIAKYVTKATGIPAIDRTGKPSRHHTRMAAAARTLPAVGGDRYNRRAAAGLGWTGHVLTKSRRYSVTFGQLRRARLEHRRNQRHPDGERDPWGRPLDERIVLTLTALTYQGRGINLLAGQALAIGSAARAREHHDQDHDANPRIGKEAAGHDRKH